MKKMLFATVVLLVSTIMQAQIQKPNPIDPPIKKGTLVVTSSPSGSSVTINGEFIGKTPITLKRNPGTYNLSFDSEGYNTQDMSVKVFSGKTTKCNAKLEVMPKQLPSPRDSIISVANEIIDMNTSYNLSTMNSEEKDLVSFQTFATDYAKGVKEMYGRIISRDDAAKLSIEELKVIITNCVLRNQHCNNLEKPCIQSALTMFHNMEEAQSNVYQGVDMLELTKLAEIVQKQVLTSESTAKIVELIGQVKLTEALDMYQQGLLNPDIIERYKTFLSVLKGFYVLSNMRLTEIKTNEDS